MEMNFSLPCGTHSSVACDPALKRRAIFRLSRWDQAGGESKTTHEQKRKMFVSFS